MKPIILFVMVCVFVGLGYRILSAQNPVRSLQQIADDALAKDVPAIFCAVARDGGAPDIAVAGVRKSGVAEPVTVDDKIHIGSCTKSFTAVLIARLADRGLLGWDDSIEKLHAELAGQIDEAYGPATIRQLLHHRSGMPANAKNWWLSSREDITDLRFDIAVDSLGQKPRHNPGSQYEYSNLGYLVASLIASKVTGKDWETLIREELFEPLKMQSAGFGPPGVDGDMSQPWGHVRGSRKTFVASQKDNAPALGPAGTIHVTLRDWCQFANVFTGNQPEGYLTAGALEQLLAAPKGGDYSCGWILVERSWAGGVALTHSGSNTMWMSTIWIAPKTKRVYIAATNVGGSGIGKMVDEIIGKLIKFDGR